MTENNEKKCWTGKPGYKLENEKRNIIILDTSEAFPLALIL